MTTNNPTSAHRPNPAIAYTAEGTQPARVAPRRGSETKAAFKTGSSDFSVGRVLM